MSKSLFAGLIYLLSKGGDKQDLRRWRPIPLMWTIYKELAKAIRYILFRKMFLLSFRAEPTEWAQQSGQPVHCFWILEKPMIEWIGPFNVLVRMDSWIRGVFGLYRCVELSLEVTWGKLLPCKDQLDRVVELLDCKNPKEDIGVLDNFGEFWPTTFREILKDGFTRESRLALCKGKIDKQHLFWSQWVINGDNEKLGQISYYLVERGPAMSAELWQVLFRLAYDEVLTHMAGSERGITHFRLIEWCLDEPDFKDCSKYQSGSPNVRCCMLEVNLLVL